MITLTESRETVKIKSLNIYYLCCAFLKSSPKIAREQEKWRLQFLLLIEKEASMLDRCPVTLGTDQASVSKHQHHELETA